MGKKKEGTVKTASSSTASGAKKKTSFIISGYDDDGKKSATTKGGGAASNLLNNQITSTDDDGNCCIIPEEPGCLVGKAIDPNSPGNAELIECSNKSCTQNRYMHKECIDHWESFLIKVIAMSSRGRGREWTERESRQNLWRKKGHEVVRKKCRCKCSGFLSRIDPADVDETKVLPVQPKKKNNKKQLPALGSGHNPHHGITIAASDYVERSTITRNDIKPVTRLNDIYEEEQLNWAESYDDVPCLMLDDSDFPDILGASGTNGESSKFASNAWKSVQNENITTKDQLISFIRNLLTKSNANCLSATDVNLMELMNNLDPQLSTDIAETGGLLPWIAHHKPVGIEVKNHYITKSVVPSEYEWSSYGSNHLFQSGLSDLATASHLNGFSVPSSNPTISTLQPPISGSMSLEKHLQFSDGDPFACHYVEENKLLGKLAAKFVTKHYLN